MPVKKEKIQRHLDTLTAKHHITKDSKTAKQQKEIDDKMRKTVKITFYLESEVNDMLRFYVGWKKKKMSDSINDILKEYFKSAGIPDILNKLRKNL